MQTLVAILRMRLRQKINYFLTKDLIISLYRSKAKAIYVYLRGRSLSDNSFMLSDRASLSIQPISYTVKELNSTHESNYPTSFELSGPRMTKKKTENETGGYLDSI